jgi:hypothetical protein
VNDLKSVNSHAANRLSHRCIEFATLRILLQLIDVSDFPPFCPMFSKTPH